MSCDFELGKNVSCEESTVSLACGYFISVGYPDATGPLHWSGKRFETMIRHRQAALVAARKSWADFLLVSKITIGRFMKVWENVYCSIHPCWNVMNI